MPWTKGVLHNPLPMTILCDISGQWRCDPDDSLRESRFDSLLKFEVGVLVGGHWSTSPSRCKQRRCTPYHFGSDADDNDASPCLFDRASSDALNDIDCDGRSIPVISGLPTSWQSLPVVPTQTIQ
jgi:hypothetical protein